MLPVASLITHAAATPPAVVLMFSLGGCGGTLTKVLDILKRWA